MTCVKIPDTRAREIRRPWRELFGFGHRAFEDLLHGLGQHLAADRQAGPAAVVLDPFADRLRVNAELEAALRYRPPVEIMQSAVSRLNSSACLADGLDTAPSLLSSSA